MKLQIASPHSPRRQAGSAVLIVFMLLAVMGVFIVVNNRILYSLKQELKLIEQKQLRKFATTNAVANAVGSNPGYQMPETSFAVYGLAR